MVMHHNSIYTDKHQNMYQSKNIVHLLPSEKAGGGLFLLTSPAVHSRDAAYVWMVFEPNAMLYSRSNLALGSPSRGSKCTTRSSLTAKTESVLRCSSLSG